MLHGCSEYVIPKEGPGTARDEGGIAGADVPASEGAAGSSGCGQETGGCNKALSRIPLGHLSVAS